MVLQNVTEKGVCASSTQGTQLRKGLGQVLVHAHGGLHGGLHDTRLTVDWLQRLLEEYEATMLALHLLQMLSALVLLLGQLAEAVAHTLQSHIVAREIEAQREVGVGGLQRQGDQAVDGRLH